jgi:hypothetical protein
VRKLAGDFFVIKNSADTLSLTAARKKLKKISKKGLDKMDS